VKFKTMMLFALMLMIILAIVAQAQADKPTNTLELRYGKSARNDETVNYIDFYRTYDDGSTWEIFHCRNPYFDYQETGVGVGQCVLSGEKLTVIPLLYLAAANDNQCWLEPSLYLEGKLGKVNYSAFAYLYVPLNSKSPHQAVISPAKVGYQVGDGWQVGVVSDWFKYKREDFKIRVGPMIQKTDKSGSWGLWTLTSGGEDQFILRRVTNWK
jgi:hypothetical protein